MTPRRRIGIDLYDGAYGPTLRIDTQARHELHAVIGILKKLASGAVTELVIEGDDLFALHGIGALKLQVTRCKVSGSRVARAGTAGRVEVVWTMDRNGWKTCLALTSGLLHDDLPRHQYLSNEGQDEVLVEVAYLEPITHGATPASPTGGAGTAPGGTPALRGSLPWLLAVIALLAVLAFPLMVGIAWLRVLLDGNVPAKVIGTVAHGRIEHAHVIPPWGPGYVTYSFVGSAAGRQYVDGRVRDTLLATFAARSRAEGGCRFVVGETGWPWGGRFKPHRSHQNGMAVDVFMPVQTKAGTLVTLATWPWNKFGYGLEFDERGEIGDLRIQFESVAAFLLEVEAQAGQRGLRIGRVIIAPEFVPLLLETPSGRRLGALADRITRKPAWVRHDEHFHIDFEEAGASGTGT